MAYVTESTISCQYYVSTCYDRNKSKVENILVYGVCLLANWTFIHSVSAQDTIECTQNACSLLPLGRSPCKPAKEGRGCSFMCSAFNHKRVPMPVCFQRLIARKNLLKYWTTVTYNRATSLGSSHSDSTKHSEW